MTYDLEKFFLPDSFTSSVPSGHFVASLKTYREQNDNHKPRLITLFGPVGTGKTWDACAFANNARAKGRSVGYVRASDLSRIEPDVYWRIEERQVLVLDDYGVRLTQGAITRAFDLIDRRLINKDFFTLMTTNIISEIRGIDERLASRLNTGCVVDYDGMPDRRIAT